MSKLNSNPKYITERYVFHLSKSIHNTQWCDDHWHLYHLPTKLREGNVCSPICLSVQGGVHIYMILALVPLPYSSKHAPTSSLVIRWYSPSSHSRQVRTCSLCNSCIHRQAGGWHSTEMPSCAMLNCTSVKRNISGNRQCQQRSTYTNIMSALVERQKLQKFWRNIIQESDPAKIDVVG